MKEGWKMIKLTDISENLDYMRVPITKNVREVGKYPYYGASGIVDYVNDYIYDEDLLLISEDGANLLARATPIAFSVSGKIWVNNHAHVLKFKSLVTQRFVEYFIAGFNIKPYVTGMAQPKLNQKALEKIKLPLPPLEEQHRIVGILDAAFEKIDALKANAEANLKNAKALFQQVLAQELQPKEGWVEKKFAEVIKLQSGDNLPAKNMREGKYPVYGGNGVSGYHDEYNMEGDNIIIGRVGALCGNVRYLTEEFWLTDNGFKVIINSEFRVDLRYLTSYLNFANLRQYAKQAAQPVISNVALKGIKILLPPLEEQHRIVATLDTLSEKCRRLEQVAQQTIRECDALKQSILRQAFSGEL